MVLENPVRMYSIAGKPSCLIPEQVRVRMKPVQGMVRPTQDHTGIKDYETLVRYCLMKDCLVKVMVFPVVMYGCESWTIKKAEH